MVSESAPSRSTCWCGNTALNDFSDAYGACSECGTLVSRAGLRPHETEVRDDDHDFYGKAYWLERQCDELGFPDIYERARLDLPERCIRWLRTLLGYRLPPARILELGSGHGAFVALMRAAGFDATGLELSPWVVEFARRTFGVPMLCGPVETQALPGRSFDVIVLNDVLEHLADPARTMARCAELLGAGGSVQVQTPCYPEGQTYQQLVETKHPFLAMLQPREHLYLFSRRAVERLFAEAALPLVAFEPALFPYDMMVLASSDAVAPTDPKERETILLASSPARLVRALLDLDDRARDLATRADETERDRQDRIGMISRLNDQLEATARTLREQQAAIEARERDRQDRIEMIARLNRHIEETGRDYEARGRIIGDQQATIEAIERDRQDRIAMIERLNRHIEETSRDYEARGRVIDDQQSAIQAQQSALRDQQAAIDGLRQDVARMSGESAEREKFLAWLASERDAQLRVIAEQHATIDKLVHEGDRQRADLETLARESERTRAVIDALNQSRVMRLLRALGLA